MLFCDKSTRLTISYPNIVPVVFSAQTALASGEKCCISLTLQMKRPPAFELWHSMTTKQILVVQRTQPWMIMVV